MLGRALSGVGRHAEAAEALYQAVESPRHAADALAALAACSEAGGDREAARRLAHLAALRDPAQGALIRAYCDA